MQIECEKFQPYVRNTLQGFVTLRVIDWGLVIHDCTFHIKGSSAWIGFPSKKYDTKDGTTAWTPLLEHASDDDRKQFQSAAVKAIENLRSKSAA
jgi:hypothetical protein